MSFRWYVSFCFLKWNKLYQQKNSFAYISCVSIRKVCKHSCISLRCDFFFCNLADSYASKNFKCRPCSLKYPRCVQKRDFYLQTYWIKDLCFLLLVTCIIMTWKASLWPRNSSGCKIGSLRKTKCNRPEHKYTRPTCHSSQMLNGNKAMSVGKDEYLFRTV